MNLEKFINKIEENKGKLLPEDYWKKIFEQNNLDYKSEFQMYVVNLEDKEIIINYEIVNSYYFTTDNIKIKNYKIKNLNKDNMKLHKL